MREEGVDELLTENRYIQRYVIFITLDDAAKIKPVFSQINGLADTVNGVLEQLELSTGMKAIILIGGPTPAADGELGTHWYAHHLPLSIDADRALGTRPGDHETPTSRSLGPGRGLKTFMMCLLSGCALSIVCIIIFLLSVWALAYSSTAEEEFSRRRGYTDFLKFPTPTPTLDTETASTQSPSEATSLLPSSLSVAETVDAGATDVTSPVVITSPAPPSSPSPQPQEPFPNPPQCTTSGPDGQQLPPQVIPPILSQTGPPPPETANLMNDLVQNTSDHGLLLYVSDSSGRLPPPPGALVFDGSLPFIPAAIKYFQTVRAGQRWTDMVASFLRLEEFPYVKGVSPSVPPFWLRTNKFARPLFVFPLHLAQSKWPSG